MKKLLIVLCSLAMSVSAGSFTGTIPDVGGCGPTPFQKSYVLPVDHVLFRNVAGKTYNLRQSVLWCSILGEVGSKEDGIVILRCLETHNVMAAVTNYIGDVVADKPIHVVAMRTGTYNWGATPLELWDCGTPYVQPPATPDQIAAAQEAAKIAAQREKQKQFLAQSNSVVWLQLQATNGDASAQYSLGLHYLNGQGCDTNRGQAIFWLQKAAVQGDMEASNKLSKLKSP